MLSAHGLSYAYGAQPALRDVSLAVERGEILGILGPNGSGKSTLLKLLAGVLPGEIAYEGRPLSQIPRSELAQKLAFVPQRVEVPFPFTGRELVMMGRYARMRGPGLDERLHEDAVRRAMEETGVAHLASRRVTGLSGGEAQRLRIAQALAQEPEILLLDEPTSHLDVNHQLELMELLVRLGRTVVASLHDLNLAAMFCTRLVLLKAGTVAEQGPPAEVLTPERLERVFGVRLEVLPGPPLRVFLLR